MDGQKCLHVQCTCFVDLGERYCGDHCRERAEGDVDESPHERCGCRHTDCSAAV